MFSLHRIIIFLVAILSVSAIPVVVQVRQQLPQPVIALIPIQLRHGDVTHQLETRTLGYSLNVCRNSYICPSCSSSPLAALRRFV